MVTYPITRRRHRLMMNLSGRMVARKPQQHKAAIDAHHPFTTSMCWSCRPPSSSSMISSVARASVGPTSSSATKLTSGFLSPMFPCVRVGRLFLPRSRAKSGGESSGEIRLVGDSDLKKLATPCPSVACSRGLNIACSSERMFVCDAAFSLYRTSLGNDRQ